MVDIERVGAKVVAPDERLVMPVGGEQIYEWTANLNGVNSYGRFETVEPVGDFDLYGTVLYQAESLTSCAIIGDKYDSENNRLRMSGSAANPKALWSVGPKHTGVAMRLYVGRPTQLKLSRRGNLYTLQRFGDDPQIGSYTETQNTPVKFALLGERSGRHFKGQITNIKFEDHENPDNSRFFKNIIRSANMPTSTVLVDELGNGDGTWFNLGSEEPYVRLIK